MACLFFLHKASTCGEDHKRDFFNHFSTIIYVPIVQIWITCIKRKENAINQLNIANEPRKMPNLHSNYFMVYVEHRKKSSANNEDTSSISQNLSGSLSKPRNFIGDGSICEDSTWQQSQNHLKFLPLHYEVKSWHHAKFELFLTYFSFSLFSETKKSIKKT